MRGFFSLFRKKKLSQCEIIIAPKPNNYMFYPWWNIHTQAQLVPSLDKEQ